MAPDMSQTQGDAPHERTALLASSLSLSTQQNVAGAEDGATRRASVLAFQTAISKEERALGSSNIGEKLPYNEYTTIDWMHDLVKDSYRVREIHNRGGLRGKFLALFDSGIGWFAAALMGTLTACVAFLVDICEATVSDWKMGYCKRNPLLNREGCCLDRTPFAARGVLRAQSPPVGEYCEAWHPWTNGWWREFGVYAGFALAFGIIAATATTFTKRPMPAADADDSDNSNGTASKKAAPKSLYMAAGAGIAEIKCILSGFEIPHFLDFRVLFVKAFGATFAVATGMCLGKEGPFVHISGCVSYLVASMIPKYRNNGRKMREILSAGVAAGLSVAFGAPIGGVLFSYEEISTWFPRKVLWRAFLCSMFAAIVLKGLNPTGTGKLVLFETDYGTTYLPQHYFVFVMLGVAGGLWGGIFCKMNFLWSKWFRSFSIIKNNPVFEVALVVAVTVLLQYPNPLTRESGDVIISNLLVNCKHADASKSWVCQNETSEESNHYTLWLAFGCLVKLVLTIVTFGAKVPSGIIIPALDGGALFGRLVGQFVGTISPGIFAMVGAGAFLAGVSRMTISLCVIMFELTGELEYVLPHMIAILTAKWVADALSAESVYDLTQAVLGHPFLDLDAQLTPVQRMNPPPLVRELIPPRQTMDEITIHIPHGETSVPRSLLASRLDRLKSRGLMDAGLVLVSTPSHTLQGYIGEAELDYGLNTIGSLYPAECAVRLLDPNMEQRRLSALSYSSSLSSEGNSPVKNIAVPTVIPKSPSPPLMPDYHDSGMTADNVIDLTAYVDRTPLSMSAAAPAEYALEAFGKLGLRHLMITEEGSGRLIGVCLKKRLLGWLEELH